jgi:leucyl-tRNA synthetase
LAQDDVITVAVQVNGKLRDTVQVAVAAPQAEVEALALGSDKVKVFTDGKTVAKVIYVPGKLVNVVVK